MFLILRLAMISSEFVIMYYSFIKIKGKEQILNKKHQKKNEYTSDDCKKTFLYFK